MRDTDNLCANCFDELTSGAVCSNCGYDNDSENDEGYLPVRTVIADRYVIGAFQSQDSDAITYMGYDTQLDKIVEIREFFPKGMASRFTGNTNIHVRHKYIDLVNDYMQSFYKLWSTLQKLQSLSAVVPVYDIVRENSTIYAIIEHMESISLRDFLIRNSDGYLPWDKARLMFLPVLTTIEALHNNKIIHGSITPDSLLLCADGKVRLSPFTIQEATVFSSELEFNVHDGYTAIEQYDNKRKISPSTDIYAFSACIYRALVGTNPPDAISRETNDKLMIPNSIAESIPMHVIKALVSGIQIYPEKRINNISDFREMLEAAPRIKAQGVIENAETRMSTEPYEKKKPGKGNIAIIILVVLIIIAMAAGIYVVKFTDLIQTEEPTTTADVAMTYEVPNFANNEYTQTDVENNGAWNKQFSIKFDYDYSTDVEEGIIFKQSVKAGDTVEAGSPITLTVSKGIQTEEVPNVGGLTLDVATQTLEGLGFKVSSVEVYNDGSHVVNTVKSNYPSAPAPGDKVAVGEEIVLQVYGEVQTTTTQPSTDVDMNAMD